MPNATDRLSNRELKQFGSPNFAFTNGEDPGYFLFLDFQSMHDLNPLRDFIPDVIQVSIIKNKWLTVSTLSQNMKVSFSKILKVFNLLLVANFW